MIKKDKSIELQRHLLGSVDLFDLDDKIEISEQERKDYCAAIFAIFPRLEKDIKKFMQEQLKFSSMEAETWEQVIFGRGTYNGMALLLENWRRANDEHIANNQPKEEFDKSSLMGEL